MSEQRTSEHFDLARFVLGYLEHEGSVAAAPAFGVHEVLLPDELAAALRVESYLKLTFDAGADAEAQRISVNHPLVEAIADRLTHEVGYAQVAINHVRLEKRGLFDVAVKSWSFPNARLAALRDAVEQPALHHYLRFNFKVTFLSDEKQEQIISVVLDVQGGYAVHDAELLDRLVSFEAETTFSHMTVAPPRWQGAGDVLAPATLHALLSRAVAAAEGLLTDRLAALHTRTQRFLELDRARLEDYYDSLEHDLKQRLARTETTEVERRRNAESKLEALAAERSAKLADSLARHQIRVELDLINVLLTIQPKITLPIAIANRRVTVTRYAIWNPLIHRLEPLVCDVCGQPGEDLHLCTGGHLAHRRCLAPQCTECNRTYCQLCADQMRVCVVCEQPVCRASLHVCPECGRGTCAEHQTLCHGAAGQPLTLKKPAPAATPRPQAPPPPAPAPKPQTKPPARSPAPRARPAPNKPTPPPVPAAPTLKAVKLHVEIYEDDPHIVAFVMRSTSRVLATRAIDLTPDGIRIACNCEKSPCPANGWIYRPAAAAAIQEQVEEFLVALRQEYFLPPKRVDYLYVGNDQRMIERPIFSLPSCWRREVMLAAARQEFDRRRSQR